MRARNTYLLQWNVFTSIFNRFFYKTEIKRTLKKPKDVCDVNCLIPGAILCLKFNYSDVTSMKPPLPWSFSFFFFIEKVFENRKSTVEIRTYSAGLNPPSPVHSHNLLSRLPTFPKCVLRPQSLTMLKCESITILHAV